MQKRELLKFGAILFFFAAIIGGSLWLHSTPTAHAASGGPCPIAANYVNWFDWANPLSLTTLANLGVTQCFYVAANGNDTNNGTSESSPWAHAPGMPNCSGNCLAEQNVMFTGSGEDTGGAGTGFIFRGGDTWHFSSSGGTPNTGGTWALNNGSAVAMGTAANPIYIGVDLNWYSGSSWTRPILNADNPINASRTLTSCPAPEVGGSNVMFQTDAGGYLIFDDFEMLGLCERDLGPAPDSYRDRYISYSSTNGPVRFSRNYIHGWSHVAFADPFNPANTCTPSTVCVSMEAFDGSTEVSPPSGSMAQWGDWLWFNVVDGSDSDPVALGFSYGGDANIAYNYIGNETDDIETDLHSFHDNIMEDFISDGHSNLLETAGVDIPENNVVFNNVFRHLQMPPGLSGDVLVWLGPAIGYTDYFFNNLMYDAQQPTNNYVASAASSHNQSIGTMTVFNNTIQTQQDQPIIGCEPNTEWNFTTNVFNNQFITESSPDWDNTAQCETHGTFTYSNNLVQTNAQSTAAGYSMSQTPFALAPTSASSPTVSAGLNESSICSTLSSLAASDPTLTPAATACQSGTTYACGYNQSNHTMVCPAETPVARPTSGAWDVGAYQYSSSGGGSTTPPPTTTPPGTPTGLTIGASTASSISFSWNASGQGTYPILGYDVYRNGSEIGSTQGTTYTDTGLSAGTTYSYSVSAYDSQGNISSKSGSVSGTTIQTTTPVTPTSTPVGCSVAGNTWDNIPFAVQSGTVFSVSFTATPEEADTDGVIGISTGAATWYTDMAAIVRFNTSGTIDAYNTSTYMAANAVPYTASNAYHFVLTVNPSTGIYGATVSTSGLATTTVATNYEFRNTQAGATSFAYLNGYDDLSGLSDEICNVTIAAIQTPVTPTSTPTSTPPTTPTSTAPTTPTSTPPVTTPTSGLPVGTTIVTEVAVNVRSGPSVSDKVVGVAAKGIDGTITAGPTSANGYTWWNIDYASGLTGWSAGTALTPAAAGTAPVTPPSATPTSTTPTTPTSTPPTTPPTPSGSSLTVGTTIVTGAALNVRSEPSVTAKVVSVAAKGVEGTITAGPTSANGYTWWEIDYANGISGWSAQNWLTPVGGTAPVTPQSPTSTTPTTPTSTIPITPPTSSGSSLSVGMTIVTGAALNVRSAPSVTASIVTVAAKGIEGTILSGPVSANGYTWWEIDYATGISGWSAASWLIPIGGTAPVTPPSPTTPTSTPTSSPTSTPTSTIPVTPTSTPTSTPPVSTLFTIGESVEVSSGPLNIRQTPSTSGTTLGTEAAGNLGTVTGGPTNASGYNWWDVNWNDGLTGWSVETYMTQAITVAPVGPTPAPTSSPVTITTASLPNGTVGTAYSTELAATGGTSPYTWTDPSCSGSCNTGMSFYSSGILSGTPVNAGQSTFTFQAKDAAGNTATKALTITIAAGTAPISPTPDTTPPSVPTGLQASAASENQINLSWNASTDNVGVTGYKIYRGGNQIATTQNTSYQDIGLSAGISYTYTVAAYDAAGNTSAQSGSVSAVTESTPVVTSPPPSNATLDTVNWNSTYQTIDGFGAYNAWAPIGSYENFIFSTLGYSLLRVSLPIDDSCDSVSQACATGVSSVADMQSCLANGCEVWASVSSPPGDMKTNGNAICTVQGGTLISSDYQAYANYISNYIASLKQYYNITLYAVSVQNEPETCTYGTQTEAFSSLSSEQFDTFIKSYLGPTLAANGQSNTLIMMPESATFGDLTTYASTCMSDPACSSYVGLTAFHDYDNASQISNPYSLPLWETEVSVGSGGWDPSIGNAVVVAEMVHTNMVGGVSAFHYFWYVDPLDESTPYALINPSQPTPISASAYAIAQWAKFVRPGWVRIDANADPTSGVYVTAFKDPSTGQFAIVAVNANGSDNVMNFPMNGFSAGTVTPWVTSGSEDLTQQSPVSAGSSFTYDLPAQSIVTFVGTNG